MGCIFYSDWIYVLIVVLFYFIFNQYIQPLSVPFSSAFLILLLNIHGIYRYYNIYIFYLIDEYFKILRANWPLPIMFSEGACQGKGIKKERYWVATDWRGDWL